MLENKLNWFHTSLTPHLSRSYDASSVQWAVGLVVFCPPPYLLGVSCDPDTKHCTNPMTGSLLR